MNLFRKLTLALVLSGAFHLGAAENTADRVLNEHLLKPSLGVRSVPPGDATIGREAPGALSAPPDQRPQPFEIIFETPAAAPMTQQIEAISCALQSVLKEYRAFIAQGIHL
jgi:protein MpaA